MSLNAAPIAVLVLGLGLSLHAGTGALAQGEGSHADNPDLLRGSFAPFCEPAMLCHYAAGGPGAIEAPAGDRADRDPVSISAGAAVPAHTGGGPEIGAAQAIAAGAPGRSPVPPGEPIVPPIDTDLSIGLRGGVVVTDGVARYEASLVPHAALIYRAAGAQAELSANAQLAQPEAGDLRIGTARLDGRYGRALNRNAGVQLDASVGLSQDDPRGIDAPASGAMTAPLDFDASAGATYSLRLGRANVALRGEAARETFEIGGTGGPSDDDVWRLTTGLRAGYEITPIASVFIDGSIRRDAFDRASADLGVSRSGWAYGLRTGVSANWSDVWTAELSAGYGWRTFDAGSLADVQSVLYGAAIGFNPNPTTALRLRLDTELEPGTGGAVSSVDHTLALEADHKVNRWLGLRGSASAGWRERDGGASVEQRYAAGAGADLTVGAHTDLNLDYGYLRRVDPERTPSDTEEHRLSAGLTLQY